MQGMTKTVDDDLYNVNGVDQRIERGKALLSSLAYSNHLDNIYRDVVYHMDTRKIFLDSNLSLNKLSALIGLIQPIFLMLSTNISAVILRLY